jgi:predicted dehydrogenase
MARRYRVGIVGAGIGARHVEGFLALPDQFEVAVIADRDHDRAAALAAKAGAAVHGEFDAALLARDDLDIIDICLPPFLHFDTVSRALRAGRHVVCEKPLVGSLAEADALDAIARASGRTLMPVFQARFGNGLAKARHLMDTGAAGRVYLATVETHWSRGADYYAVPWRGKFASELGGAFTGHAIHIHDMLTTLLGPVRSVAAATAVRVNPIETEDCGGAVLEMANGAIAVLSVTLGSADQISRLRVMCENVTMTGGGTIYACARDPWEFVPKAPKDQAWLDAALAQAPTGPEEFAGQFALYHAALEGGGVLPVTVAEARRAIELLSAIYHSARTGERVQLPIPNDHPVYHGWR